MSKRDEIAGAALDAIDKESGCGQASATWVELVLRGCGLAPNSGAVRAGLDVIDMLETDPLPGDIVYLGGVEYTHGILIEDEGKTLAVAVVDSLGFVRLRHVAADPYVEVRSIASLL